MTTDGTVSTGEQLLPDALAFVAAGLAARGGLVEPLETIEASGGDDAAEGRALVLLPGHVAQDLGLPEEVRLVPGVKAGPGQAACGLGTPLLSRMLADARGQAAVTYGRLRIDAPRPSHAAALGARFVVRNGLADVLDVFPGEATYVAAGVTYVAEADDRHEGLVHIVVHGADGGQPDAALQWLLNLSRERSVGAWGGLGSAGSSGGLWQPLAAPPPGSAEAMPWIARRSEGAVRAVLQQVQAGLMRRHARDHARIAEYFAALIAEARAPRRRVDAQAVAAKVSHLVAERDTKLAELGARFGLRVTLQPATLLCVVVPIARVRVRLRRRKEERELVLRLPAGALALDRLACDGCEGVTARPALCDDRLHLLCEVCAPSATGRPRCPACRSGRPASGSRPR